MIQKCKLYIIPVLLLFSLLYTNNLLLATKKGSSSLFTIFITVISPGNGEIYKSGTQQFITWKSGGIDSVKVEYSTDNGNTWLLVSEKTGAADGYIPWTVPNTLSTQCKIRVTSVNSPAVSDESDDVFIISDVTSVTESTEPVNNYIVLQNYPNPFNPVTSIRFSIPADAYINLSVYNSIGELVLELINGYTTAGLHEAIFNATGLSSGTYYYTLRSGNFRLTKKMVVSK